MGAGSGSDHERDPRGPTPLSQAGGRDVPYAEAAKAFLGVADFAFEPNRNPNSAAQPRPRPYGGQDRVALAAGTWPTFPQPPTNRRFLQGVARSWGDL